MKKIFEAFNHEIEQQLNKLMQLHYMISLPKMPLSLKTNFQKLLATHLKTDILNQK